MEVEKKQPERKRIIFAEKVMPKRVRNFFSEKNRHRETYFVQGILVSSKTALYLLKILITFLTEAWGLKLLDAVLIRNLNEGLASILEFYMLLLADLKLEYFWLLFCGTIAYCVGLRLLSLSYPQFTHGEIYRCTKNNECPSNHPKFLFYFALVLITIGKSSTTICLDEFKPQKPEDVKPSHIKEKKGICMEESKHPKPEDLHKKEKKFIRYGWLMLVVAGSIIGSFVLPYAPIGWDIELQVCAYMMGTSFVVYWLGTLFYSPDRANKSPFSSVCRVVISAIRYRHLSYDEAEIVAPETHGNEMDNPYGGNDVAVHEPAGRPRNDGSESDDGIRVDHISHDEEAQQSVDATSADHHDSEMNPAASQTKPDSPAPALSKGILRFLNKAKAEVEVEVQEIEDTKKLFGLFPLTLTVLMYGAVKCVGNTFFLEQANDMDLSIGSLHKFPLAGFIIMAVVVGEATSKIYDFVIRRQKRSSIRTKSDIIKIGSGLLVSIFCCIVAWAIEEDRLQVIRDYGLLQESNYKIPMSAFWLTPQFALLGAMNGLTEDGIKGFFKHQAPSSMKNYANALAEGVYGAGTILFLGMIFAIQKLTGRNGRVGWFADSIDESRLDSFYKVLAVVSAANIVFFVAVGYLSHFEPPVDNEEEESKGPSDELQGGVFEFGGECVGLLVGAASAPPAAVAEEGGRRRRRERKDDEEEEEKEVAEKEKEGNV